MVRRPSSSPAVPRAVTVHGPADALAALEAAASLGRPVVLDVALTGDALSVAVDAVRKQIAELSAPTTQPATRPAP